MDDTYDNDDLDGSDNNKVNDEHEDIICLFSDYDFVLPSHFKDYHPSWKKYEKTFLDVYIVARKTKELLDVIRKTKDLLDVAMERLDVQYDRSGRYFDPWSSYCDIYDQRMETIHKDLEIFQTVSKKRSTIKLVSVLPGLPDLQIH